MQYILNEEEYQTFVNAKFWQTEHSRVCKMFDKSQQEAETLKAELATSRSVADDLERKLQNANKISTMRCKTMNRLSALVHRLKNDRVAIMRNSFNGRLKVVSVTKVDTYQVNGWEVYGDNDYYLVDRPTNF